MNKTVPITCLVVSALLSGAPAGPLRPEHVAADATWLIHVDVEAVKSSTSGRYLIEHAEDFHIDLEDAKRELGIDPVQDLFGATLYGSGEDGTVVLEMSAKIDEILTKLAQEEGYHRIDSSGRTIHHWDGEEDVYACVLPQGGRRVVVMAEARERVESALDVLERKRGSLAGPGDAQATLPSRPRPDSLVFAVAHGMPWLEKGGEASAIVERSDRIMFEVRERQERTMIDLVISARSQDDARNIADIVRGFMGVLRLIMGENADLKDVLQLLNTIDVASENNDIAVKLEAESRELLRHLEQLRTEIENGDLDL